MATKLTKFSRNEIRAAMLNYAYESREAELHARIASAVYEFLMSPQRASLPPSLVKDKWISSKEDLVIRGIGNRWSWLNIKLPKPVPVREDETLFYDASDEGDETTTVYGRSPAVDASVRELHMLVCEKQKTSEQLDATLKAVTTVEALVKLLPEAADFVPSPSKPSALVPQAQLDSLRSIFAKGVANAASS